MAYSQSWVNSTPAHPIVVTISPTAHDVLLAWQVSDVTSAAGSAPTGFDATPVVNLTSTFDNSRLTVWIKADATGSETSVSMSESSANLLIGGVIAFSGINNTTPQDVTAGTFSSSTSGTTASASVTPVTNGVDLFAILDADTGGVDSTFSFATSSGTTGAWTVRQDQNSGFYNVGVGTASQTTAGAITVDGSQTQAGGRCYGLIVLRPVLLGPTINQQPGSVSITDTDNAYLKVVATTSGGSLTYQWQDNRSGSFANCSDGTGATGADYITASLATTDTGRQYRCIVIDSNGSTTSSVASITIIAKRTASLGQWDPDLRIDGWF